MVLKSSVVFKNTNSQSKFYTSLQNIVEVYTQKVDSFTQNALATLPIIDTSPADNLPLLEDIVEEMLSGDYDGPKSILVSARIGDLYSGSIYNRIDSLNYANQEKNLKALGGFSYKAAGVLTAFLRPLGVVVLCQGNNRVSMLFAVTQDPNARIAINLNLHDLNISEKEMTRIEAENHTADASLRTNQTSDDRFKSAYHANIDYAVNIFNFLKPYSIGIAGTLENAKFNCTSHSYVDKARKDAGDEYVKRFLEVHTKVFSAKDCSKDVYGNFVRGGAIFLSVFSSHIAEVDKNNGGIDSFYEMMKHYFAERKNGALIIRKMMEEQGMPQSALSQVPIHECLTQSDITIGNRFIKIPELFVCRFVSLYNEYCKQNNLTFNKSYATAIPINEGKKFSNFIQKIDPILRQSFIDVAKSPVVSQAG